MNVRRSKTGADWVLLSLIFVLIAFGSLYAITYNSFTTIKEETEGYPCKMMLKAQNLTREKALLPLFKERCATLVKTLPEDKDTVSKKDLSKEIAELLARTWWTVDEGRIKNLWNSQGEFFWGTTCFIRYAINIDQEFAKETGFTQLTKEDLYTFLMTETYREFDEEDYTYAEYIYLYGGKGALEVLPSSDDTSGPQDVTVIRPGTVYAIAVKSPHEGSWTVRKGTWLFTSWVRGPFLTVLDNLRVTNTGLYEAARESLLDKDTVLIISSLDYAQQELGCSYI